MISRPTPSDYDELLRNWEASVRSTHHFLAEENIQFYKPLVREQYFPAVELFIIRNENEKNKNDKNEDNKIVAFMGLSDELIEMLFVHPDEQGKGYGKLLIDYAINEKQLSKVDVNEQNEKALCFYLKRGFDVVGRDAMDSSGQPFPILHMELVPSFAIRLSTRFHMEDIQSLLSIIRFNTQRKEELYRLIYHEETIISYQALWICTHLPLSEKEWLQTKQQELIDEALRCPHTGKRRILLQLLEKQSFKDNLRVDFLDFCLERMLSPKEPPGVQSLCIKLAYKLCLLEPDLMKEFRMMLEMAREDQPSPAIKSSIRNIMKKIKTA